MKNKYVLLMLLFTLVSISCKKESSSRVTNTEVDVYVVGDEYNGINSVAKYWKNGIAVNLTYASKYVEPSSIYVSGNDVYVAGKVYPDNPAYPGESIATYWKNGIPVNLTDGASANSITVSGNDVYVAGYGVIVYTNCPRCTPPMSFMRVAKYWKNGNPINLSDGSKDNFANSITVSGNDVYVAGTEYGPWGNPTTAKYWKNGQPVNLSSNWSEANSITVSGNDVCVAGEEDYKPTYWKNGTPVKLSDEYGEANSIAISGGDVYVAVTEYTATGTIAKYWKNGNPVTLSSKYSYATSIAASGNDIYVAGGEYNGTNMIAGYWKNGIRVNLTDGVNGASAYAIFIVPQ